MNSKIKKFAVLLAIASSIPSCLVNATNSYHIEYSGGEPLGADNVQINPTLVNGLTTLMQMDDVNVQVSSSDVWKSGFMKNSDDGECLPFKYFTVPNYGIDAMTPDYSLDISNNQYRAHVLFKKVTIENPGDNSDNLFVVGVTPSSSYVYGGWQVFKDSGCTEITEGTKKLLYNDGSKLYVEMYVKLYKANQESVFTTEGLYFGITDIDAAQSYKVLNANNGLTPANMYAKSAEDLQNNVEGSTLKNMFVESNDGNYIYSQFNDEETFFTTPNVSNIYLKLNTATQEEGLDLVFGFAHAAASGIEYYARQLNVTYKSDNGGDITGIRQEKVIVNNHPSGSKSTPKKNYIFKYWIADKDVTLNDGSVIKAGDPITSEKVKKVVVTEDLEFTAIHEKAQLNVTYDSDENGKITGIKEEKVTADDNPSGSESTPKEGYKFTYWVADKDVVLEDGTEIEAGDPITSKQVKEVVVTEDLKFTAIHTPSKKPNTPYTGANTGEINAIQISASIIGILTVVALICIASRLAHKKVNFD